MSRDPDFYLDDIIEAGRAIQNDLVPLLAACQRLRERR
jgi:hypothetical protein